MDELLGPQIDGYQILLRELKDLPGTLSTRARLRKPTPTVHLCNRLLHDYRGGTSSGLWRTSRTLRAANGTRDSRSIEHGWSRNVLIHQIESNLYERQGKALTNFSRTLPAVQSELAQQLIKDPYSFDFLALGPDLLERDLERGLLEYLRSLILELGKGFAFVGSQYRLDVGGQDFYLDLLFYHLRLRRFVVIDLKIEEFKPEFAGKMNFYLSAVDEQLRHPDDGLSIGIILCKSRNELIVEYALRDTAKPMGVSQYRLSTALPDQFQSELPTLEEFARELPYLSLVAVRIEIERALRVLMTSRGLEPGRGVGIGRALRELKESGEVPSGTEAFVRTLATMNEAVRGIEVEPAVAAEALRVASEFLAELRRLTAE